MYWRYHETIKRASADMRGFADEGAYFTYQTKLAARRRNGDLSGSGDGTKILPGATVGGGSRNFRRRRNEPGRLERACRFARRRRSTRHPFARDPAGARIRAEVDGG